MKNYLLYLIRSKIILKVQGKNINNFIKRLRNNNIDLLNIKYIDEYIFITIYKSDYSKVLDIKTIYDIDVISYKGLIKVKKDIINNKIIIIFIILSIFFIYLLSNTTFSIDVITNDFKMEKELINDLSSFGIKKYKLKKSYKELQSIKESIKNKYKDRIEWIEIESVGTKYIVRYEPRIIDKKEEKYAYRNIISKKDAVITNILVSSGEVVKSINTYVKKGEVIVSGKINLNETTKDIISSNGTIYGEVWYKVNIKYPYKYYEIKETGKKHNMLSIIFLSNRYNIFNKYKTSNIEDNIILKENILPISITFSKEKETIIIDENNNYNEVIDKAMSKSKEQISKNLKDNEYIKDYKILNKNSTKEYVELTIFFTIIENITDYEEIVE